MKYHNINDALFNLKIVCKRGKKCGRYNIKFKYENLKGVFRKAVSISIDDLIAILNIIEGGKYHG